MLKWYRNRITLNETLEQNKIRLEKTTSDKTKWLLMDYNNVIKDHLELLEQNEKLKNVIDILKDKVDIIVKTPNVWLETKDNCLYFKVNQQEYKALKEVLGNGN